jgi:limonene-1,2-epoxide hydrolase
MNIKDVASFYQGLGTQDLSGLHDVYHKEVVFRDPLHEVHGLDNLYDYFAAMYENTEACKFEILHSQQSGDSGFITWRMHLNHPRLKGGDTVLVDGCSQIGFTDQRISFHRDYFDAGQMLYENLPLLGGVIRKIKQRVGQ